MILRALRLPHGQGLPLPAYQTAGAAGLDLSVAADDVALWPGDQQIIPTGFAVEIPAGYVGLVRGRSGLAFKQKIWIFDGTIDSDYRGEIKVLAKSRAPYDLVPLPYGTRIAQLLIVPVATVRVEECDILGATERAEGGFGSTGA